MNVKWNGKKSKWTVIKQMEFVRWFIYGTIRIHIHAAHSRSNNRVFHLLTFFSPPQLMFTGKADMGIYVHLFETELIFIKPIQCRNWIIYLYFHMIMSFTLSAVLKISLSNVWKRFNLFILYIAIYNFTITELKYKQLHSTSCQRDFSAHFNRSNNFF